VLAEMREGGCRCGQIRFRVSARPLLTIACHCSGCQRMASSAFSLSARYPSSSFELTAGTPTIGGMRAATRHYFCPSCMSWMFTRLDRVTDFLSVRPTMLDDNRSFRPFIETYISEMLPWARTPAVHRFEKFPPAEAFPALLAEFAQRFAGS
jgi:hypothetical protein